MSESATFRTPRYERGLSRLVKKVHNLSYEPKIMATAWSDAIVYEEADPTYGWGEPAMFEITYKRSDGQVLLCQINTDQIDFANLIQEIVALCYD